MKALISNSSLLIAAACLLTSAGVDGAPDSRNTRQVRFLAVGDSPPYRQEIRNGVRTESAAPAGSVPPREVTAGSGDTRSKPVPIGLNRISEVAKLSVGVENFVLRDGGTPDAAPWLSLKCPASDDLLVCLYRDPAKPTWKDALSLVLPAGPKESPAGSVRIVNLYSQPARISWAGVEIEVPAGGTVIQPVTPDSGVQVHVDVADPSGKKRRYFSGEIVQKPDERGWIAIYGADQPDSRRPVKVLVLREKAAPPSP